MDIAIFVLDSVLFDNRHRKHLVNDYKADASEEERARCWTAYWARSVNDTPLPTLKVAVALLNRGVRLILSSGRPQVLEEATRQVVEQALREEGADPAMLANIQYDLRVPGEDYNEKVGRFITDLKRVKEANLLLAIVKNNGFASKLRRAWPTASVCNMGTSNGVPA